MKYQIIGKNIEVTEGIKTAVETKLEKLSKYKETKKMSARVLVRTYTNTNDAKITVSLYLGNEIVVRAEERHPDLYAAIDLVVDKLCGQLRKLKSKKQKYHQQYSVDYFAEDYTEVEDEPVKDSSIPVITKNIPPMVLSMNEAIIKMETLGYDFFMYLDAEDHVPSVVYKNKEGAYGLLQMDSAQ